MRNTRVSSICVIYNIKARIPHHRISCKPAVSSTIIHIPTLLLKYYENMREIISPFTKQLLTPNSITRFTTPRPSESKHHLCSDKTYSIPRIFLDENKLRSERARKLNAISKRGRSKISERSLDCFIYISFFQLTLTQYPLVLFYCF